MRHGSIQRSLLAGAVLATALAGCSRPAGESTGPFSADIRAADLSAHTRTLSSDAFGGRPPSGPGADRTVAYLTGELERLGLRPTFDGAWSQPVPLVSITASPDTRLSVRADGVDLDYAYGSEMMAWTTRVQREAGIGNSELVFVGYGINAPEHDWNDYAGIDMDGKTAVILVNDPGFATGDDALFDGKAMTWYGRWTYKYDEAARQGAAAAIIVHETAPASYGWSVVENSWTGEQFDLRRPDGNASRVAVEGWVQYEVAREIFAAAGMDYDVLKERAANRGFEPVALGLKATLALENEIAESGTVNVAGTITGSARPDEHILYTAHWDHLGRGAPVDGDAIYNGAADNAAGVAAALEIAARMATNPPERSVTFLFVGAEEQGLLGAYHYAANPAWPLARTAALINIDVLLPLGNTRDVTVIGRGSSELEEYLERAAAAQDRAVRAYANPEQGFYFRSDHFAFTQQGVPALYLDTGTEHVERGSDYITEAKARYVAEIYHTPFDEWQPDWDWTGVVRDVKLMYETGHRLAMTRDWPEWYAGNPFKAIRDDSRAARDN